MSYINRRSRQKAYKSGGGAVLIRHKLGSIVKAVSQDHAMCWGPTLGFMEPRASESLKIKQTYTQMNRELHTVAKTMKEKNGVGGHTENDGDLLSTAVIQGGLPEEGTIRLA